MSRAGPCLALPEPSLRLENGSVVVRARRVPGMPVVAVRVLLCGGARQELIPGQAYVTGRMLAEGSQQRSWRQIAEDLEARGALLASAASFEALGLALDTLADDWQEALEWAAELALTPAFPEDRCAWVRRQVAAELESLGDQPEVRAAWTFMEQLYTPSPRARRLQGDPESLQVLTSGDCAGLHQRCVEQGILVAVAGDIDPQEVAQRARELFPAAGWRCPVPEPPPADGGAPRLEVPLADSEQAHLYLGHLTLPRHHPDLTALELAGVILGSGPGLTGRIPQRVREQQGLAYSAHVQTIAGAGTDPGRLVAYVGTSPETVEKAERSVAEELERLCTEGIEDSELETARSYLLGREPFRRETARQWADLLAEAEFYGLPLDDPAWREGTLRALDRPAVEAAVREHLRPGELKVTVGLPSQAAAGP